MIEKRGQWPVSSYKLSKDTEKERKSAWYKNSNFQAFIARRLYKSIKNDYEMSVILNSEQHTIGVPTQY